MSDVGATLAGYVKEAQREQFARVFDEVSPATGIGSKLTFAFVALGADYAPLDDKEAYAKAFDAAAAGGWLAQLIHRGVSSEILSPQVLNLGASADPALVKLQGIANEILGFPNADKVRIGMIRCLPKVCFVRINVNAGGTGFLIGPDTIITAWHVIAPLLDQQTGEPAAGSSGGIEIIFDYYAAGLGRPQVQRYQAAQDWLLDHSPCTAEEALGHPGAAHMSTWIETGWTGSPYLDFAVVRVNGAPGRERGAIALDSKAAPPGAGALFLLQHPSSDSQKLTMGSYNLPAPPNTAAPRFHHLANAVGGSSGGLCLNEMFDALGLHQAGRFANGILETNVGVPGASIAPHLRDALTSDPANEPLWKLREDDHPVLGREQLIDRLPALISGEKPILIVRGLKPKAGLSFSVRIARQFAPADHHFIEIKAEEVPASAAALGALILARLGEAANTSAFPGASTSATTTQAWLRDQFWPEFSKRLGAAAGGRTVWIVIDNLEKYDLPVGDARDLLEFIYAGIRSLPYLRIMLIGLQTSAPGALATDFSEETINDDIEAALEVYLRLHTTAKNLPVGLDEVGRHARMLSRMAALDGSSAPLPVLAKYLAERLGEVL